MPVRARKIAAILCAAAVATGAGIGVASQSSSTAATSTTAGAQQGPGGMRSGPGGMDVAALAKQLGVTQSKLEAALAASRPSGAQGGQPPSGSQGAQPPSGGQRPAGGSDRMATALAQQLGLSTAKVKAALDAARPAGNQS
jgi:hypothetical protein